ncbi:hypothetical protein [Pseudomonas rustica]|uniref:hypothetical protein n=1 Tax=Pseudomonas rustica TaxID=2827099 RepID=UPI001BAF5028|nr:hypothetical protein [Pseudomonas rustica]MBS4089637.1 hypothetical protein [Pseudomonas rustica]
MAAATLEKPIVFGMKEPVSSPQPADGGLPLALTYLYPQGVRVLIDPPASVLAGDTLALRLNDQTVTTRHIAAGEENQTLSLYVGARLWQDALNTLEYGLVRADVELETSHPLRIWFHKKRPGLVDLFPQREGHSELKLEVAQSILDQGVNTERAHQGVGVSLFYPLMRAGDRLNLDCNGIVLSHVVTESEVELGKPVVVIIDEATFIAAGDNPNFPLSFTVYDCLDNGPDTNSPDSADVFLFVNLNGTWFDPPIVSEDANDAEDDPDILDLDKLDGAPAMAQIYVPRSWLKGDEIHLTCRFRGVSGGEATLTLTDTVKNAPFLYKLPVPNDALSAATGGTAVFFYTRVSGGVPLERSEAITVSIVGAATSDLLPPTLVGSGDELDPLDFPEGLIARIEYADARDGDQAKLLLEGGAGLGSPAYSPIDFTASQRADFLLTPAVLAANHGKTLRLSWQLLRAGDDRLSDERKIIVQPIKLADWRLPIPDIPQALVTALDLSVFDGDAQVICKPWPAIAIGQMRWLRVHGVDHDDHEYEIIVANGAPVTEFEKNNGLDNTLPRDLLKNFKSGAPLHIELKVAFDGAAVVPAAVAFKVRDYEVLNSPSTLLEDFAEEPYQSVKKGGVMETKALKITFQKGDGECAIMPREEIGESFPGRVDGPVLSISRDAFGVEPVIVELELKRTCSRVSFWQVSVNYEDCAVEYLSADRTSLGSQVLGASLDLPVNVVFAGAVIKFLIITCPKADWFSLDNIRVDD